MLLTLGGAIAVLGAVGLKEMGYMVQGVVTFGSPRIGNQDFENFVSTQLEAQGLHHARYAAVKSDDHNVQDIVTTMPPNSILGILKFADPVRPLIKLPAQVNDCSVVTISGIKLYKDCSIALHYPVGDRYCSSLLDAYNSII